MNNYKTTIGIEVHCELKTKTKMFSDSINDYGNNANININLVDFAYPGVLPTINRGAVELALKAALALNCTINKEMFFDRKNYFYPDLPKGYQITQARSPIGVNGYVEIDVNDTKKKIRIHDIHIEEDTCKSIHHNNKSLLDFNRTGVPLIEIVSEADMQSPEEAMAYLDRLRELLVYADVSDCKIEEGSMRCDVNVSVSKTETLGTRTETKNIGSISNVGRAITAESARQIEIIEQGGIIQDETRRFDESLGKTILMRVKETGNDYRYFPEPDIPKLVLTDEDIKKAEEELPISPNTRRDIYKKAGINPVNQEKIISNKDISDYLLDFPITSNLVIASNLLLGDISAYLNKTGKRIFDTNLDIERLKIIADKLDNKEITNKQVKEMLIELLESTDKTEDIINKYKQNELSTEEVEKIIKNILKENADKVEEYKSGNERLSKFFIGQVMKETKGNANPVTVNKILMEELNK